MSTTNMQAPDPVDIYKAGVKNLSDFAAMWFLTLRGEKGAGYSDLAEGLGITYNAASSILARLQCLRWVVSVADMDKPGHPVIWKIFKKQYRLMTDHMKEVKA